MSALIIDMQPLCYRAWAVEEAAAKRANLDEAPFHLVVARLTLMAMRLVRTFAPELGAAVYEGGGDTWRHELLPTYKDGRPGKPTGLKRLITESRTLMTLLGFTCLSVPGEEADDVVASLVAGHKRSKPVVVSSDKDFYQLLNDCLIYDPMKPPHDGPPDAFPGRMIDARDLYEKFGVSDARQVIEVQAIAGDLVDRVPGCRGIGMLGAVRLIQEFKTVENLYAELDRGGAAVLAPHKLSRYAKPLAEHRADVLLSRQLVTLKRTLDVRLHRIVPQPPAALAAWAQANQLPVGAT